MLLATFAAAVLVSVPPVAPAAPGAASGGNGPARALSLEDAVRAAVAHNLDLLQQRLVAHRAAAQASAAWWGFTPDLQVSAGLADIRSSAVPGDGTTGKSADSSVGLAWQTPLGTQLGASLALERDFAGPSSHSDGALVLSVSQPLLKDAWLPGASAPLEQTALAARIAKETLRGEVEQFIVEVEGAYWDLALAQADVAIKERSLERARQQREDTAENIRRGILADVEIYLVDENLVFFESELARAQEARESARRHLAELLWLEPDAPVSVREDLGALRGSDGEPADLDESLQVSVEGSPGLAEQRLRAQLASARERTAAVHALPQLDLDGSIALGAKGDIAHPAAQRVFTSPVPDARVGVVFSLPLGVPAVQASVDAEHVEAERERLELDSRTLALRHAIEGAVGELALNLRLEKLGRKQLDLADKKLTAQNDKYKNGISTLADVVRFQRELDEASIALRQTVRAVHVSRARLLALEGRLAETAGVEVQTP